MWLSKLLMLQCGYISLLISVVLYRVARSDNLFAELAITLNQLKKMKRFEVMLGYQAFKTFETNLVFIN